MMAELRPMHLYNSILDCRGIPELFRTVRKNSAYTNCIIDFSPVEQFLLNRHKPKSEGLDLIALAALTVLPAWSLSKVIYRFDKTLIEELGYSDTRIVIPSSVFDRLPVLCPYIAFKTVGLDGNYIDGFFVAKVHETNGDFNCLVLLIVTPSEVASEPNLTQVIIRLDNGICIRTLLECIHAEPTASHDSKIEVVDAFLQRLLSPVLYLCSAGADIQYRTPALPSRHIPNTLPEKPRIADVGLRIGSVIRSYRIERSKQDAEAVRTGRILAPHVRRAHWHHFWTGPMHESRILILKWIPPIPVKLDKAELPVTIRPVKA